MSDFTSHVGYASRQDQFEQALVQNSSSVFSGLTSGAMVVTRNGEVPVEWLETGDDVLTRDRGFMPVRWINRVKLDRNSFRQRPDYAPVSILSERVDDRFPLHDISVAPDQLVMIRSPLAERDYWSNEVLVPARALGTQKDVDDMRGSDRAVYTQIMLQTHEAIIVDGLWCGSLFTGAMSLEIDFLGSRLATSLKEPLMRSTRPILNLDEARVLISEIDAHNINSASTQESLDVRVRA